MWRGKVNGGVFSAELPAHQQETLFVMFVREEISAAEICCVIKKDPSYIHCKKG